MPVTFLPGNGDGTFGTEIDSAIKYAGQPNVTECQPPAGNALALDMNADGIPDLVFGSGAVVLGDGKGDFSLGAPLVEVAVGDLSHVFDQPITANLGTIQGVGDTYPTLVFLATSDTPPFPLVARSTASGLVVEGINGDATVTVTVGQSGSLPLTVAGPAGFNGSVHLSCTLLLASVGIYGLLAYMVGQRAHEIGVRMALGAKPSTIGRMIVSRGASLAGIGVGIGLLLSGIMAPLISSLLYGVRTMDPEVFIAVPLILMVVVLLASYIPARRAARVSPVVALREC